MKFIVTMTTTNVEDFEIDAISEEDAVETIQTMFNEGELDDLRQPRPEYDITFTCGNAVRKDWIQSLI